MPQQSRKRAHQGSVNSANQNTSRKKARRLKPLPPDRRVTKPICVDSHEKIVQFLTQYGVKETPEKNTKNRFSEPADQKPTYQSAVRDLTDEQRAVFCLLRYSLTKAREGVVGLDGGRELVTRADFLASGLWRAYLDGAVEGLKAIKIVNYFLKKWSVIFECYNVLKAYRLACERESERIRNGLGRSYFSEVTGNVLNKEVLEKKIITIADEANLSMWDEDEVQALMKHVVDHRLKQVLGGIFEAKKQREGMYGEGERLEAVYAYQREVEAKVQEAEAENLFRKRADEEKETRDRIQEAKKRILYRAQVESIQELVERKFESNITKATKEGDVESLNDFLKGPLVSLRSDRLESMKKTSGSDEMEVDVGHNVIYNGVAGQSVDDVGAMDLMSTLALEDAVTYMMHTPSVFNSEFRTKYIEKAENIQLQKLQEESRMT